MFNILTLNCQYSLNDAFPEFMTKLIFMQKYDFLLLQEVNIKTLNLIEKLIYKNNYGLITQNHLQKKI